MCAYRLGVRIDESDMDFALFDISRGALLPEGTWNYVLGVTPEAALECFNATITPRSFYTPAEMNSHCTWVSSYLTKDLKRLCKPTKRARSIVMFQNYTVHIRKNGTFDEVTFSLGNWQISVSMDIWVPPAIDWGIPQSVQCAMDAINNAHEAKLEALKSRTRESLDQLKASFLETIQDDQKSEAARQFERNVDIRGLPEMDTAMRRYLTEIA